MQFVTGPLDGATIIRRAVALANCPDDGLDSICGRLKLLRPGSPYLIDQRGRVYAPLPGRAWRKKTHRRLILRCRVVAVMVLEGGAATLQTRVRSRQKLTRHSKGSPVIHITPGWPGYWWQSISLDGGSNEWTVPTLDALVAAAASLLEDAAVRSLVRQCPQCRRWFIRPAGLKQATCEREDCREAQRKQKARVWIATKRANERARRHRVS